VPTIKNLKSLFHRQTPISSRKLTRKQKRILTYSLLAVFILFCSWIAWQGYEVYRQAQALHATAAEIRKVKNEGLSQETLEQMTSLLPQASSQVEDIHSRMAPFYPVFRVVSRVPKIGALAGQAEPLIEYTRHLIRATLILAGPLKNADLHPSDPVQYALQLALEIQAPAENAAKEMDQAQTWRKEVDVDVLPESYQGEVADLDEVAGLIETALPVVQFAPTLVGDIQALQTVSNEAKILQDDLPSRETLLRSIKLVHNAAGQIEDLETKISPYYPLIGKAGALPGMGSLTGQVEPILGYISHVVSAVDAFAGPIYETSDSDSQADLNQYAFAILSQMQAPAGKAKHELAEAQTVRARIDDTALPASIKANLQEIDHIVGVLDQAIPFLQIAPALLGADGPQTYMIILQNRDELRPSGGFITDYGMLRLDQGKVTVLQFHDVYQIQDWTEYQVEPPKPIRDIMMAPYLVTRDANWSPDFPTTARMVKEMYRLSTDITTDGVIAFDQGAVVKLLELTGPVSLDDKTITAENVEQFMIDQKMAALQSGQGKTRKEFIEKLAPILIKRVLTYRQPGELIRLEKMGVELIRTGHMSVYFENPDAQSLLEQHQWANEVVPGAGDYLMVVDANVGFNKLDGVIQKSVDYTVNLQDLSAPQGEVDLHYQNPLQGSTSSCKVHDFGEAQRSSYYAPSCYWDYWRIFTNGSSQLKALDVPPLLPEYLEADQSWDGSIDIGAGEGGSMQAGGMVVVPMDQTRTVRMQVIPPGSVVEPVENGYIYHLRVQKQAGIKQLAFHLALRLPADLAVQSSDPGWSYSESTGCWEWNGNISETTDFSITLVRKN
jgi:hypothetical protein